MKNCIFKRKCRKYGLTLIEVLIVVGILSILVLLLIPFGTKYFVDAKVERIKGDTLILEKVALDYSWENNGQLPVTKETIRISDQGTQEVIKFALTDKGVSTDSFNYLQDKGAFKKLDKSKIGGRYKGSINFDEFFIVDDVFSDEKYKNQIKGVVFTIKSFENSKGAIYSGRLYVNKLPNSPANEYTPAFFDDINSTDEIVTMRKKDGSFYALQQISCDAVDEYQIKGLTHDYTEIQLDDYGFAIGKDKQGQFWKMELDDNYNVITDKEKATRFNTRNDVLEYYGQFKFSGTDTLVYSYMNGSSIEDIEYNVQGINRSDIENMIWGEMSNSDMTSDKMKIVVRTKEGKFYEGTIVNSDLITFTPIKFSKNIKQTIMRVGYTPILIILTEDGEVYRLPERLNESSHINELVKVDIDIIPIGIQTNENITLWIIDEEGKYKAFGCLQ